MKTFFTFLITICCLSLLAAQNQSVEISGRVFYGTEGTPARSVPVNLYTEAGVRTLVTDAEGRYFASVPLYVTAASYSKLAVEVRDVCTGSVQSKVLQVFADSLVFRNVDFTICQNITPPPPPETCQAFFAQKADPNDSKTFYFQDLSFATAPIVKWTWAFGDNTTSNEQNPKHTYSSGGIYIVSLTITTQLQDSISCTTTFKTSIYVNNSNDCNCTREYVPVCVITESGSLITFPNKCLAVCAGYTNYELGACQDSTCVCPAVYDPVCVKTADGAITQFGNACEAACQGYTERDFVPCQDTCDCPTDEYIPVCVVVNGDTLTFTNACRATCAGFKESDFVQCDTTGGCFCPEYYAPVCVIDSNGDTLTFSNKCFAYCAGYAPEDLLECRQNDCVCDAVYDPVCIATPSGTFLRFSNKCEALCAGYTSEMIIDCDSVGCNCPKILDPVCAIGPNGDTLTFTNKCFAICEGYNPEQLFQCRPNDCICPPVIDPVCVQLADGQIIRYNSKCEALCNGFKESDIVACDSSSCVCPEYYAPVCVITSDGDTLTFDNPCFAECKGYTADQYFHCSFDPTCACPLNLDPVCVKVDGYVKEFPNACVAKCYGFTERDFVRCERDTSSCVCPLYYAPVCAIGPNGDTITFSNKCFAACAGYEGNEIFTCSTTGGGDPADDCTAAFSAILQDSTSLTIQFKDFSKVLNGTILGWKWEFGDGTYGDSQNPTHTYARPGVYTVTQYIATSTGCTTSSTRVVYVGGDDVVSSSSCQAIFTFAQLTGNQNTITFRNLSIGNFASLLWEFGDGYTSTEKNPTHTYAYNGVFFVKLTIRGADCESATSMVVFIDPNAIYDNDCNALFLPALFVDSLQVAFKNLSSPDAIEFKWDFGDGTTSTEFAPFHTYQEQGIYEVTLTITTSTGCTNTFRAVLNLSTQNFTGNPAYSLKTTGTDDVQALRDLKLYPNPVKNEVTLEFNTTNSDSYLLQIFSMEGRLMQTIRESAQFGNNIIQLDTNHLPAGMYLLRIQTAGQVQSIKFIKQ